MSRRSCTGFIHCHNHCGNVLIEKRFLELHMGLLKNKIMEQEPYGYRHLDFKNVCYNCFSDYAIQNFIKEIAGENTCDYCGSKSDDYVAAEIDEVIKFIMQGVATEYGDPDDEGMSYDSDEGGYQGTTYTTDEIFYDEIESATNNEDLAEDIHNSLVNKTWCQKNHYFLTPAKALIFNWRQFSEQVKHRTRYIFFRLTPKSTGFVYDDPDYIPTSEMLDRLAQVLSEASLSRVYNKGEIIYRSRVHKKEKICNDAASCGPPLAEELRYSNRMSPAGIPMFYGSLDSETTIKETFDENEDTGKIITISKWELVIKLRFLDLTNIPSA